MCENLNRNLMPNIDNNAPHDHFTRFVKHRLCSPSAHNRSLFNNLLFLCVTFFKFMLVSKKSFPTRTRSKMFHVFQLLIKIFKSIKLSFNQISLFIDWHCIENYRQYIKISIINSSDIRKVSVNNINKNFSLKLIEWNSSLNLKTSESNKIFLNKDTQV
jgi:hypothetical protein